LPYFGPNLIKFPQSKYICSNFASIYPNLVKYAQISPHFYSNLIKICRNLINFTQRKFDRRCGCIPCITSFYGTAD